MPVGLRPHAIRAARPPSCSSNNLPTNADRSRLALAIPSSPFRAVLPPKNSRNDARWSPCCLAAAAYRFSATSGDTTRRFALLRGGAPALPMMLWVGLMDYPSGSRGPLSANNWHSTAPVSAVAGAVRGRDRTSTRHADDPGLCLLTMHIVLDSWWALNRRLEPIWNGKRSWLVSISACASSWNPGAET